MKTMIVSHWKKPDAPLARLVFFEIVDESANRVRQFLRQLPCLNHLKVLDFHILPTVEP
jgi:hypothetical protein